MKNEDFDKVIDSIVEKIAPIIDHYHVVRSEIVSICESLKIVLEDVTPRE